MTAFFPYHGPGGQLWFDLLAVLVVAAFFDRRIWSMRNVDLLLLCAWAPLGDYELGDQPTVTAISYVFLIALWARVAWVVAFGPPEPPPPNLGTRTLNVLSWIFLVYCLALTVVQPFPFGHVGDKGWSLSESGIVGTYGGDQILHGHPPYGNIVPPVERPAKVWAVYGPAYFLWFVPGVWIFGLGRPFFDADIPARLVTVVLTLLSFVAIRRIGKSVAGDVGAASFAFAWTCLPYLQHAAYWSWTGHLLPGFMSAATLLCLVSTGATMLGLVVGLAVSTSFVPLAWVPLVAAWLRSSAERRRFVIIAAAVVVVLFAAACAQADGPTKLWRDVASYMLPGQMPAWRYKWSPFVYHAWARVIRAIAIATFVPAALAVWIAALRNRLRDIRSLAAGAALLLLHAELIKGHAPGRMVLWTLPFLLACLLLAPRKAQDEAA